MRDFTSMWEEVRTTIWKSEKEKMKPEDLGIQNVFTPVEKIEETCNIKFADFVTSEMKEVAILFNVEFLQNLIKYINKDYISNIHFTFFYDSEWDLKHAKEVTEVDEVNVDFVSIMEFSKSKDVKDLVKAMGTKHFDIVFSNPPYDGSLHLEILNSILSNLNKNGNAIFIHPNDHLHSVGPYLYWNKNNICDISLKHLESFHELDHRKANDLFGLGNGISWGLLIGIYNNKKEYTNSFFENEELSVLSKIFYHKKMFGLTSLRNHFVSKNNLKEFSQRIFRMHNNLTNHVNAIICFEGRAKEGINFNSLNEKNNFINSIECWPYKLMWLFNDTNPAHLPFMDDYTTKWSNERFYTFFNITEKEKEWIMEMMKHSTQNS